VARIVLINGAPGSGKSTLAQLLADAIPMALALDVDVIKHSLGSWQREPTAAGYQARRLALAMADEHLGTGYDVIVGQYLARTEFIEQLESLARRRIAEFIEFVLLVDQRALRSRLERRAVQPDRSEQGVNTRLVSLSNVPQLVTSMEQLLAQRPAATPVDASGTPAETVSLMRRRLSATA
jgi:predicted kinase